jgi:hypothetical protein
MGMLGVQGRLKPVLVPDIDRKLAGLGLDRGEAGNGEGLGEAGNAKLAPVGRMSSRCLCNKERTTLSSLPADCSSNVFQSLTLSLFMRMDLPLVHLQSH